MDGRMQSSTTKERTTTMTTKKSTGYVTETRRCTGSQRFGFEPHEAPISTFPKQPSRKDGLGVMCSEHWKMYVKGLRDARMAAAGTEPKAAAARITTKPVALAKFKPVAKKAKPKAKAKPSASSAKVAKAEALIAEVDALPAAKGVRRVGDDDVQAALETTAGARGASMDA